jgi:hypothetical protein
MAPYAVLDELRVKTSEGIKVYLPGAVIRLPKEKAVYLVLKGKLCSAVSFAPCRHNNRPSRSGKAIASYFNDYALRFAIAGIFLFPFDTSYTTTQTTYLNLLLPNLSVSQQL